MQLQFEFAQNRTKKFYRSTATFKVMLIPTLSESGAAVARNCKHTECFSVRLCATVNT